MTPGEMLLSLRYDAYAVSLKRDKPRSYAAFVDVLLLIAEWGTETVADWIDGVWAVQLGLRLRTFVKFRANWRERGLMHADGCTPVLRVSRIISRAPNRTRQSSKKAGGR